MEDGDGFGFDAAVIAIDGLVGADDGVLETIGLLPTPVVEQPRRQLARP
jgi:hypothetical protein